MALVYLGQLQSSRPARSYFVRLRSDDLGLIASTQAIPGIATSRTSAATVEDCSCFDAAVVTGACAVSLSEAGSPLASAAANS